MIRSTPVTAPAPAPAPAPKPVAPYPGDIPRDAHGGFPPETYATAAANLLARLEREQREKAKADRLAGEVPQLVGTRGPAPSGDKIGRITSRLPDDLVP